MGTLNVSVAMSALIPILKLDLSCIQTATWVIECLNQMNLKVTQTFNLRSFLSGNNPQGDNVGQDAVTDDQVIIFQVRKGRAWAALLLYGKDGQTWVSISRPSATQDSLDLVMLIQSTLQTEVWAQK